MIQNITSKSKFLLHVMYKIDKYRYLEYLPLQAFTTEDRLCSVQCLLTAHHLLVSWFFENVCCFPFFFVEKDVACVALLVHSYYSPHIHVLIPCRFRQRVSVWTDFSEPIKYM